ncbi:chlororespiratory reduction protein 7 [Tumidithrix elongata RA019]|uniref:Chlororespiratory reduction protein 7 n=1 Tax=Tumidithrix elongata BACA0141 TaxID=2716417 RepID=A0AAW9PVK3_9CYAN|nr:chlororespiratory reduction protein 7 [Tumidithrix elongata RA019]
MPSSIMYYEDNYVVLAPSMTEQFMTASELENCLRGLLADIQDNLPLDLQKIPAIDDQVQRLLKTACELDCGDAGTWQWYAVRLEK